MSRIFCFRLSFWLSSLFWALPVLILAEDLAIASKTIHNAKQASVDHKIALTSASIKTQGQEIRLKSKTYPIPWIEWQQGTSRHLGISDIGAMQLLGLEFLSTDNPQQQPIQWFSEENQKTVILEASYHRPYRYLDLGTLLQSTGVNSEISGNTLSLNFPDSQITDLRHAKRQWGHRIVVELDTPAPWQISQAKSEAVVIVGAQASPSITRAFTPNASENGFDINIDEDDLGSDVQPSANTSLFSLDSQGNSTKIKINLPPAHGIRTISLADPYRLVIDIRPDTISNRRIAWADGLTWHQQIVSLGKTKFPVNWLEVNRRSPNITLKPILANNNGPQGTAPLISIARTAQAAAAINGGFFNRNNQYPLGAIRRDNRWLAGPILNRGAIGWNEQGAVKIDRLSLRDTFITPQGRRLPVPWLNSAYLTKGFARYTSDWGSTYQPLTDNEIIFGIENGRVTWQQLAPKAGMGSFPVPRQGALLVSRKTPEILTVLPVGGNLTFEDRIFPTDFANYSQILGGGPLLVQNRRIVLKTEAEKFSQAFQQQKASRSAIGNTSEGNIILAVVHHRIGGRGATLGEMAKIMQQLGAINALNLDGGSSTALALGGQLIDRSPITAAKVHNGIGVFVDYPLLF